MAGVEEESLRFHDRCDEEIRLSDDGKTARGVGSVFSSFQVKKRKFVFRVKERYSGFVSNC